MKLGNSRRTRAVTAKKCTKKEYCTCKTVVLSVLTHSDFSDVLDAVAVAVAIAVAVVTFKLLIKYSNNSKCVERIVVVPSPINRFRLISEERCDRNDCRGLHICRT